MKIHKLEIIVLDPNDEELTLEDVKIQLENNINDWIVHIIKTKTINIKKKWDDNSPFNYNPRKASKAFDIIVNKK